METKHGHLASLISRPGLPPLITPPALLPANGNLDISVADIDYFFLHSSMIDSIRFTLIKKKKQLTPNDLKCEMIL